MPLQLSQLLKRTIDAELPNLRAIPESDAGVKTTAAWSRKEELGHLMEPEFHGPSYDQNGSVTLHGYQDLGWSDLLEFWRQYNTLLPQVMARIPEDKLNTPCRVGDGQPVTPQFLIVD